jgi:hypothetical protein
MTIDTNKQHFRLKALMSMNVPSILIISPVPRKFQVKRFNADYFLPVFRLLHRTLAFAFSVALDAAVFEPAVAAFLRFGVGGFGDVFGEETGESASEKGSEDPDVEGRAVEEDLGHFSATA